ncbi:hypothetical protein [Spirosoma endbachense]|uniref:Peptidase M41 domain-containing protein n=1 Tax=Spirosoma endbachense TaxID=2666025 RepID=A0A6P1VVA2_9BACT|nr:hypothetical protein [Spirosoma endbachense]QHV96564.1 hypothetical protein GJR95_16770 [Spirosoma endbachense]
MCRDKKTELYATAVHEAAHLVVGLLGYEYGEITVSYAARLDNDLPNKISIECNNTSAGFVDNPNSNEYVDFPSLANHRQSWHLIRLLAGYAAETSYELSIQYTIENVKRIFNNCKGDLANPYDFCKVTRFLDEIIDSKLDRLQDNHEIFIKNALIFWRKSLEVVEQPLVREAVCNLADKLVDKTILSKEEIIELRNKNLEVAGIDQYLIMLPIINLKI